jgi:hypothetical protein
MHFVSQLTILPDIQQAMCQKTSEPGNQVARHSASYVPENQ